MKDMKGMLRNSLEKELNWQLVFKSSLQTGCIVTVVTPCLQVEGMRREGRGIKNIGRQTVTGRNLIWCYHNHRKVWWNLDTYKKIRKFENIRFPAYCHICDDSSISFSVLVESPLISLRYYYEELRLRANDIFHTQLTAILCSKGQFFCFYPALEI